MPCWIYNRKHSIVIHIDTNYKSNRVYDSRDDHYSGVTTWPRLLYVFCFITDTYTCYNRCLYCWIEIFITYYNSNHKLNDRILLRVNPIDRCYYIGIFSQAKLQIAYICHFIYLMAASATTYYLYRKLPYNLFPYHISCQKYYSWHQNI